MPQDPLLTDQIQIEPGSTGTRLIDRDDTDDSLRFTDPSVVATLLQLVGIRNIEALYLVGSGDGAPYTTIQEAIDAVPDTADPDNPHVVAVTAGVYSENLVITKNGIRLVGLGGVRITNAAADATISILDVAATTPESVVLRDLVIENTTDLEECILIDGSGTFASATVTVNNLLAAADTLTIGGVTLTGVASARGSGDDNFDATLGTVSALAAEIAAAINDPANSFAATVVAEASGAIVTITAVVAGVAGNGITIVPVTTPGGGMTASGSTAGGSAAGSPVGQAEIVIARCRLVASGNGTRQISADTVNNIRVMGGTWRGSSSTSLCWIRQCSRFILHNVEWVNDLEFFYDDGVDQPAIVSSEYQVTDCPRIGGVICQLFGTGSLLLSHIGTVTAEVAQAGDRTLTVKHSHLAALTLNDTTAGTLVNSPRGVAAIGAGTPTLKESVWTSSVAHSGAPTLPTFDIPQPDTNYEVFLSPSVATDTYAVTAKTTTDFTITADSGTPATVGFTVVRQ
jgi:hypothetical protein